MDSYPQPPNRYMPPPPPPPNPHFPHHQHQQPPPSQRPPPPPPFPPQGPSWYSSSQFQYHPSPSPSHSHSPSPPPPQPWGHHHLPPPPGAPHPDHLSPYPPPPHQQVQYPPFPHPQPSHSPQMAPPPHSHGQAYPGGNQDWGNANWPSHAGWNNPAHANEEDWAAKAKAWADARAAMENQHPSQQSQYPGHYPPSAEPHFQNNSQTSVPMPQPSYENYPAPTGAPMTNQTPLVHYPEPSAGSSGNSFRSQEGSFSYVAKDGNFHDAGVAHLQQEGLATQSINKQEVPSSYSSAPDKQDAKKEQLFTTSGMGNSAATDQTPFQYVGQSAYGYPDPRDQPLEFTPRFSHESNPKLQPGYAEPAGPVGGMDAVTALPSYQSWMAPVASNSSFPTVLPTYPSATQQDPPIGVPPLTAQQPPMLGGIPGPNSNFPPVPSVTMPTGLGGGTAIHPSAFPGDLYGMGAERPKKAAVPDWLRDEIIKKRDVITSSGLDHANEGNQSFEDEPIDKSVGKSIQADIRSVDSSRSTEEEEDDEDEVAAARTAAINLEIKRILTEVLLKVTTDLFDEIATRVLSEDDLSVEDTHGPAQKLSSPVTVSTAKASAKVLIPVKSKEYRAEDASEKSSSGAAGNVLGLANYSSSSDEEDDEIRSSNVTKTESSAYTPSSSIKKHGEENHCKIENGHTSSRTEEGDMNKDHTIASSSGLQDNHGAHVGLSTKVGKDLDNDNLCSLRSIEKKDDIIANHKNVMDSSYTSMGDSTGIKATDVMLEGLSEGARRRSKDVEVEDPGRENREESQRSSTRRTSSKELDSLKKYEKGDETHGRRERSKDLGHEDKTKGIDSGKHSSHRGSKESKREIEGSNRVSDKDGSRRKREPSRDENDNKHRHKRASDISRSKRRRSSSVSSRDRNSKDKSLVGHSDDSSDVASGDSRRKVHMKRRNLSPSPDRSHGRQVSRSPPSSKVSQRRHSPYSSLGSSRRRRSRSRSPARRRR